MNEITREITSEKYNRVIESIDEKNPLNNYLIVSKDGSIHKTNVFQYIWETFCGLAGLHQNMCEKKLVQIAVMKYIDFGLLNDPEVAAHFDQIQTLARLAEILPAKSKNPAAQTESKVKPQYEFILLFAKEKFASREGQQEVSNKIRSFLDQTDQTKKYTDFIPFFNKFFPVEKEKDSTGQRRKSSAPPAPGQQQTVQAEGQVPAPKMAADPHAIGHLPLESPPMLIQEIEVQAEENRAPIPSEEPAISQEPEAQVTPLIEKNIVLLHPPKTVDQQPEVSAATPPDKKGETPEIKTEPVKSSINRWPLIRMLGLGALGLAAIGFAAWMKGSFQPLGEAHVGVQLSGTEEQSPVTGISNSLGGDLPIPVPAPSLKESAVKVLSPTPPPEEPKPLSAYQRVSAFHPISGEPSWLHYLEKETLAKMTSLPPDQIAELMQKPNAEGKTPLQHPKNLYKLAPHLSGLTLEEAAKICRFPDSVKNGVHSVLEFGTGTDSFYPFDDLPIKARTMLACIQVKNGGTLSMEMIDRLGELPDNWSDIARTKGINPSWGAEQRQQYEQFKRGYLVKVPEETVSRLASLALERGVSLFEIADSRRADILFKKLAKGSRELLIKTLSVKEPNSLKTPLHKEYHRKLLYPLLKNELNPQEIEQFLSSTDALGNTPLHSIKNLEAGAFYFENLSPKVWRTLLTIKNKEGKTPLDLLLPYDQFLLRALRDLCLKEEISGNALPMTRENYEEILNSLPIQLQEKEGGTALTREEYREMLKSLDNNSSEAAASSVYSNQHAMSWGYYDDFSDTTIGQQQIILMCAELPPHPVRDQMLLENLKRLTERCFPEELPFEKLNEKQQLPMLAEEILKALIRRDERQFDKIALEFFNKVMRNAHLHRLTSIVEAAKKMPESTLSQQIIEAAAKARPFYFWKAQDIVALDGKLSERPTGPAIPFPGSSGIPLTISPDARIEHKEYYDLAKDVYEQNKMASRIQSL